MKGLSLLFTTLAVLAGLLFDWGFAHVGARIGFCWMCVAALQGFQLREWALAGLAATLAMTLLLQDGGMASLMSAMDLAAFFAVFIALLTLMKESAARSGSVLSVGRFLTSQPTGRRYYATAIGGQVLAVFLNFATISLMAPLIQKGAQNLEGRVDRNLERRQISALLRGFSWFVLWAPTSLAQAVFLSLFPGVDWGRSMLLGLSVTFVMIVLGRMVDRYEWRNAPMRSVAALPETPIAALITVGAICFGLILSTIVAAQVSGASVAQSLMFIAPSVTFCWLLAQATGRASARVRQIFPIVVAAAPGLLQTATALGLSGFIGRAAAHALPTDAMGQWLELGAMPSWVFLAILPVLIVVAGQIALSPILTVVFLGELFGQMPVIPADPTLVVYALGFGWALSMSASPNATATLLIAATSGVPPTTLTWRWNGRYACLCFVAYLLSLMVVV